jgi:hypothetical protein
MEFKGTKGKWEKVTADWDLNQSVFLEDTEEIICDVKSLSHNAIYDALLISKAPEMLEMLKKLKDAMLELMAHQDGWEEDYEELEQLINEATEL